MKTALTKEQQKVIKKNHILQYLAIYTFIMKYILNNISIQTYIAVCVVTAHTPWQLSRQFL